MRRIDEACNQHEVAAWCGRPRLERFAQHVSELVEKLRARVPEFRQVEARQVPRPRGDRVRAVEGL